MPDFRLLLYSRIYTPDEHNAFCLFSDVHVMEVEHYRTFAMAVMNADAQKLRFRVVDDY